MKRFVLLGVFVLAACGGGGGGSTTPPTTPPAPQPPIANTSLPFYLPLASGNTWTFTTGAKLVDLGSAPVSCSCPDNGATMERIALFAPASQTASGSFFFTKNTPSGGTQLTNVIGVENDANTDNITIASNAMFPYGVPVMDDNPQLNESWNDGAGDASTIIAVGGTLMLPNNTKIVDIATDELTGNFNPITWSFAKGVGFTSISAGNQSASISSFFVNTSTSYARSRHSANLFHGSPGSPDFATLIQTLFR